MREYVTQTWGAWDESFQLQRFSTWFKPDEFQIVMIDTEAVGVVSTEQRPQELFVRTVEILSTYQCRGLGSAVMRSILAQAQGVPVALQVLKVNPARQLYERLGFNIVGETTTHYLMRTEIPP
ncbi:MAG: GNAT family N-acetyltransferase [Herpetosiphonaceae bacterium]|nr:GNAT family N-acetyltransferase [Herpetosiphonaceae bacterium]